MYARSCASRVFSSLNALRVKSLFTNSTAATDIRLIMNAGMEENYPTYSELLKDVAQKMGIDRQYSPLQKNRSHLLKFLPKSQDELPKRSMNDSFTAAVISLSQDQRLQDKYTTFLGQVRVGRLLENMDMFAVFVAYKHISNPKIQSPEDFPYVFVTAMVDKIDFTDFIPKVSDIVKINNDMRIYSLFPLAFEIINFIFFLQFFDLPEHLVCLLVPRNFGNSVRKYFFFLAF